MTEKQVLFFDGKCGFCLQSIRWVYHFDKNQKIDFAPLDGCLANCLNLSHYAALKTGSMVLLNEDDGTICIKSDAIIQLWRTIGGNFKVLAACYGLFPRSIRDFIYELISANRSYLGFRKSLCSFPDEAFKNRFRL